MNSLYLEPTTDRQTAIQHRKTTTHPHTNLSLIIITHHHQRHLSSAIEYYGPVAVLWNLYIVWAILTGYEIIQIIIRYDCISIWIPKVSSYPGLIWSISWFLIPWCFCVSWSSAAVMLTTYNKEVIIFHGEGFQLYVAWYYGVMICEYMFMSLLKFLRCKAITKAYEEQKIAVCILPSFAKINKNWHFCRCYIIGFNHGLPWCVKYMARGPPVTTKPDGEAGGFCGDRRPEGHVFHTSRQAMIKTYYSTSIGKNMIQNCSYFTQMKSTTTAIDDSNRRRNKLGLGCSREATAPLILIFKLCFLWLNMGRYL